MTRSRASPFTAELPFSTRETVAGEQPANRATSISLALLEPVIALG
ncbi:MAG: hypothetical protein AB7V46_23440 [Thermomicrobiales bacterium]